MIKYYFLINMRVKNNMHVRFTLKQYYRVNSLKEIEAGRAVVLQLAELQLAELTTRRKCKLAENSFNSNWGTGGLGKNRWGIFGLVLARPKGELKLSRDAEVTAAF